MSVSGRNSVAAVLFMNAGRFNATFTSSRNLVATGRGHVTPGLKLRHVSGHSLAVPLGLACSRWCFDNNLRHDGESEELHLVRQNCVHHSIGVCT